MIKITYGIHKSPFYPFMGEVVLGTTDKGVCWLGFMVEGYKGNGLNRMKEYFPDATFERDDAATQPMFERVMKAWHEDKLTDIPLDLRGTPFQIAVWEALLDIPGGQTSSYGEIAELIGKPQASRAVGSAVGTNPISLIIPCHRVVQSTGKLGNYGWGVELKEEILKAENVTHRKQAA